MRRPWFPFYVDDFENSPRVRLMTSAERGCYVTLMGYQWRVGYVPSEVADLARLCNESPAAMRKYWRRLESCFPVGEDGKRRNPRLAAERAKAEQISSKRAASAKQKHPVCGPISTPPVSSTHVTGHRSQEKPTDTSRQLRSSPPGQVAGAVESVMARLTR